MEAHTLFPPILVSDNKHRNLYQRVLTITTFAIHTQTDFDFQFVHDWSSLFYKDNCKDEGKFTIFR